MIPIKGHGRRVIVTCDERELGVVLFEALAQVERPEGGTVDEALANIKDHDPEMHDALQRMSTAAMEWFVDRLKQGEPDPGELQ
jgi:predicted RNase H-like HicB family nuclease